MEPRGTLIRIPRSLRDLAQSMADDDLNRGAIVRIALTLGFASIRADLGIAEPEPEAEEEVPF